MDLENDEYKNLTDAYILSMIRSKPELLVDDEYIKKRYNKIFKFICKCEEKEYTEISDEQVLKILKKMPNKIREQYFQKRIILILNKKL